MRLLDLYCCQGGAGMGYSRAGFEVVGVDIEPQPRYPFEFHQADALEYLAAHGHEFDAIHASPPCQRYSVETAPEYRGNHPDLIGPTRDGLLATGKLYVIENVTGARFHLMNPFVLCGSMFGLGVWRHRWFETNAGFLFAPTCQHSNIPVLVTGTTRRKGYARKDPPVALRSEAIGIDWMSINGLDEAVPPAYTEYIGRHLLAALEPA